VRYPLDPTGINPDNRVNGEIHTLSTRQIRGLAPSFGPIYAESLIIHDDSTNRLLIRGQDYQCVELLQEATLKFGKEIISLILILDQTVSNVVRIDYQVLGGHYQNDSTAIINMYETWLLDDRAVDWTNVLNKPFTFPPALHNHLLQDLYGFEPLVVALERIRNAIVLSDVPAFEALITWVKEQTAIVSEQDILEGNSSKKLVSFDRLLFALDKLNFNGITITPTFGNYEQGDLIQFNLSTTNLPDNTVLYWVIEHINTRDNDFTGVSGIVNIVGNRGTFNFSLRNNTQSEPEEQFRVLIKKNGIDGYTLASTSIFNIGAHVGNNYEEMLINCCAYNPFIDFSPISYFYLDSY